MINVRRDKKSKGFIPTLTFVQSTVSKSRSILRCKQSSQHQRWWRGFTILELLVVLAIIGVFSSFVLFAVDQARIKSRDTSRYQQANEILKALELYFTEFGDYPNDSSTDPVTLSSIGAISTFMPSVPVDPIYGPVNGYLYCASADLKSMAILVNTENDRGGSNYCVVSRGPAEYSDSICDYTSIEVGITLSNVDTCASRIVN